MRSWSIDCARARRSIQNLSGKIQRHVCREAFLDRSLEVGRVESGQRATTKPGGQASSIGQRPLATHDSNRSALRPVQTLEAKAEIVMDVVRSIGKDRTVGLDGLVDRRARAGLARANEIVARWRTISAAVQDGDRRVYTCRESRAVQKHLVKAAKTAGV